MKKTFVLGIHMVRDWFVRVLPNRSPKDAYGYAFLVHARNHKDVARKYPLFKYMPRFVVHMFTRFLWPVVLSEVEGLKSVKTGQPVKGWVITIPLTARQMIENRKLAVKRIIQSIKLAEKMGVKIVGLGALTSSMSRGGLDLVEKVNIGVTTGHAYTAYNVCSNVFKIAKLFELDRKKLTVAIVGASGSIGSTSVKILARDGFSDFILVDLPRKKEYFVELEKELRELNPKVRIESGHDMGLIKRADFIITATNAPEALVHASDLKSGAVIFDDAQPSDVAPDVFEREDVLVLEAGVVRTPGIKSHFNFGLKDREDNFCCMAELLVLASREWDWHYIINRATLESVDEIVSHSYPLRFDVAPFQNTRETISELKLKHMKKVIFDNKKDESSI